MDVTKAVKNGLLNLGMQVFPIVSALVMVPYTVRMFGEESFALFSLGVTGIVLFNYLNFGVAQAATRSLARLDPITDSAQVNRVFYSGAVAMLAIGLFFSGISLAFSSSLAAMLAGQGQMLETARVLFNWIGLASPLFLFIIYLRGCLESLQLFKYTATNRAVLNSVIFLAPLLPAVLGMGIEASVYVILFAHLISLVFLYTKTHNALGLGRGRAVGREILSLLGAGGWMTVTSLASMLFLYVDRFIISSQWGLVSVAYYIAAFDLVSRLSIVYGSITAAFFPAISHWKERGEEDKIADVLSFSSKSIYFVMLVTVSVIATFSNEILSVWISADYAAHAAVMLSILAFGIFFNAMSVTALRALLATDREKIVGTFYIAQSLIYVAISFGAVHWFGPIGACITFLIRGLLEYVVLSLLLNADFYRFDLKVMTGRALPYMLIAATSMALSLSLAGFPLLSKISFATLFILIFPLMFFSVLLSRQDRLRILSKVKAFRS